MYLPVYSEEEVKRMTQAFENPQFKELFLDYVKEIENPDNKAKYEEEIRQMERERGIDAKFIHPTPKECLHTKEHILQMNAFVNIGKKYSSRVNCENFQIFIFQPKKPFFGKNTQIIIGINSWIFPCILSILNLTLNMICQIHHEKCHFESWAKSPFHEKITQIIFRMNFRIFRQNLGIISGYHFREFH